MLRPLARCDPTFAVGTTDSIVQELLHAQDRPLGRAMLVGWLRRLPELLRPTNASLVATSPSGSLQEALRDEDRSVGRALRVEWLRRLLRLHRLSPTDRTSANGGRHIMQESLRTADRHMGRPMHVEWLRRLL